MGQRLIHNYIKEPEFTAIFDLTLAHTHLVTLLSATVAEIPDHATPISLSGTPSLQASSPALAHCIEKYHGDSTSLVVKSYHGWIFFSGLID
jgi:hypothetical protein